MFPQLPITVSRELTPATQTPHATPFQAPRSSASAKRKEASTAMGHTVSVSFVYLGDVLIDDGSVVLRKIPCVRDRKRRFDLPTIISVTLWIERQESRGSS